MTSWLVSTVAGLLVGLAFYVCVRLRIVLGPAARGRYGNMARRGVWLITILLMIGIANLGLVFLRAYLAANDSANNHFAFELWFAVLSLAFGAGMVFIRARRTR